MIATPRFVFLHLHKSGGTFVNECLLRFVPGARQVGYHLPRSRIPAESAGLPCIGLVRNPWAYYVSWYSFQAGLPRQNPLFQVLSDRGRLGFAGTVRNMLTLADDPARLEAAAAALPADYTNRGLNLPGFALRAVAGTGVGFYTFLYRYMFGTEDSRLHVGRSESLRDELAALLARVGEAPSPALREYLANAEPTNVSQHGPVESHYDGALRDLVAERDAHVIARFSYRFGD
jgi:hypothetical protein